ncbi:MAG: DUF4153 domain-containing protein [Anaerovoracaceae bacterium]|jgi:hypothetical protein
MKLIARIKGRLEGLQSAIGRYPLSTAFLLAATVLMAVIIHSDHQYSVEYFTLLTGALLAACMQGLQERFFHLMGQRLIMMGITVIILIPYYLWLRTIVLGSSRLYIIGIVVLFALWLLYILIPALGSSVGFNESFNQAFKATFLAFLFSMVLFLGITMILVALNRLLVSVDPDMYAHIGNILFTLFAPLLYLSRTPSKDGAGMQTDMGQQYRVASEPLRFWEVLLSYIIIPLVAVFTFILLTYILLNTRGEFWTNNLMEPLLVAYSAMGLLVLFLAGRINNAFARAYINIFPKVLIPVVLFQLIASAMIIPEVGLTYGRYFVLFYGIFAVAAGILGSIFLERKNHWIAGLLVVCMLISVIPPLDAFSVSGRSQAKRLTQYLTKNDMLVDGKIVPPVASVSKKDRRIITETMKELNYGGWLGKIDYLPAGYEHFRDFDHTFGFQPYYGQVPQEEWTYISRIPGGHLDITDYDILIGSVQLDASNPAAANVREFTVEGMAYHIEWKNDQPGQPLVLLDSSGNSLVEVKIPALLEHLDQVYRDNKEMILSDLLYLTETDDGALGILPTEGHMNRGSKGSEFSINMDIYIRIGPPK